MSCYQIDGEELDYVQECAICINNAVKPYVLPCVHHYCEACLRKYMKNTEGMLYKCPICSQEFTEDQARPFALLNSLTEKMTRIDINDLAASSGATVNPDLSRSVFCVDLTCKPGNGCTNVHIDDICPETVAEDGVQEEDAVTDVPPTPRTEEPRPERKDCDFCLKLDCPGKPLCAKRHEIDFGLAEID